MRVYDTQVGQRVVAGQIQVVLTTVLFSENIMMCIPERACYMKPMTILGIAGSLRKQSYNRGALHAAAELVPDGVTLDIFDLDGIPVYNQDEEKDPPQSVLELKKRIRSADALLFATPEYNYSVPGVLKNAIDWASRPYGDSAWGGKPAAIMGATPGMLGTARAQYHLRQICVTLDILVLNKPEVMIGNATEKFDEQGQLTDPKTRDYIRKMLESLVNWAQRVGRA